MDRELYVRHDNAKDKEGLRKKLIYKKNNTNDAFLKKYENNTYMTSTLICCLYDA